MKSSHWRMPLTPKIRLSSLALGFIPAITVLGWLGLWMPSSLRVLMLTLFDQLGELLYYPLAALALAGGFFLAGLLRREFHWQYILEGLLSVWMLLNWPIY